MFVAPSDEDCLLQAIDKPRCTKRESNHIAKKSSCFCVVISKCCEMLAVCVIRLSEAPDICAALVAELLVVLNSVLFLLDALSLELKPFRRHIQVESAAFTDRTFDWRQASLLLALLA